MVIIEITYDEIPDWLKSSQLALNIKTACGKFPIKKEFFKETPDFNGFDEWFHILCICDYWKSILPDKIIIYYIFNLKNIDKHIYRKDRENTNKFHINIFEERKLHKRFSRSYYEYILNNNKEIDYNLLSNDVNIDADIIKENIDKPRNFYALTERMPTEFIIKNISKNWNFISLSERLDEIEDEYPYFYHPREILFNNISKAYFNFSCL